MTEAVRAAGGESGGPASHADAGGESIDASVAIGRGKGPRRLMPRWDTPMGVQVGGPSDFLPADRDIPPRPFGGVSAGAAA